MAAHQRNGVVLSLIAAVLIGFAPLPGSLTLAGREALILTVAAVIWWIFKVAPPAYTTLLLLAGYLILGLATPAEVFRIWTLPLMWLMIGSFLIAAAVVKSGLGNRLAYWVLIRFGTSYRKLIILTGLIGFALCFLIPHPFPRALLMITLVRVVIAKAQVTPEDARALQFSVFVSITATSMFVLTGDSLNIAAVSLSGGSLSWIEWLKVMAIPALITSAAILGLFLVMFPQRGAFVVNRAALRDEQAALGKMRAAEKITLVWVLVALCLWSTDFIHHIDPAWVALLVVGGLALPVIGGVLTSDDLTQKIDWSIVVFITGALAIGTVGESTGLSSWFVSLLPAQPPDTLFGFALLVGSVTLGLHMILGSALATMSIITPPMIQYAAVVGLNPLAAALLVYSAVAFHYVFPFQHVVILLGSGEAGSYTSREVIRFGIPLTAVVFLTLVVEVVWWTAIGWV
jgi:anion transporter